MVVVTVVSVVVTVVSVVVSVAVNFVVVKVDRRLSRRKYFTPFIGVVVVFVVKAGVDDAVDSFAVEGDDLGPEATNLCRENR